MKSNERKIILSFYNWLLNESNYYISKDYNKGTEEELARQEDNILREYDKYLEENK